ncbi:helix-turn-helix transcriptional regulator [Candidatus Zixiibacteriota bacterium]
MNKHVRLIYLLNILSKPAGTSAMELARRCNVSERTIYRDIGDIAHAGFPVLHDRGYRVLNVSSTPPGNLTFGELEILGSIIEKTLSSFGGLDLTILRGIEAKVERALNQFPSRACMNSA